jgi:hypothetical protein
MKKTVLIFGFVIIFLAFLVQSETTFFDQDDFFIMGEIPGEGSIQQVGEGSSGRVLSGIPEDTGKRGEIEEPPKEEDRFVGGKLFRQIIFLTFFFLAVFFILNMQKIIFRILRI